MSTVAIDTATEVLSVGIETDSGYYETSIASGLRHSEYLMPTVDALVRMASAPRTFDLVACMRGPGSFTGLRIGMATAKGLAAASGCPLVAVPTLDVLADGFDYFPGIVVPVIDARKRRVYAAVYESGRKLSDDLDIEPGRLVDRLPKAGRILFTGPGAVLMRPFLTDDLEWRIDPLMASSRAASLLRLGKRHLSEHGAEPEDAGPLYLRESEAKLGNASNRD